MQAMNPQLAELLSSLVEAPTVYLWCQVPLIQNAALNTIQYGYLGSQKIIKDPTSFTLNRLLAIGSNSMDIVLDNTKGRYSPLNNQQPLTRYFQTGLADLTYQTFIGVTNNGAETILPMGVYLSNSNMQDVEGQYGSNTMTVGALDQFSLFQGDIYTSFPPRLYGAQNTSYYNPNYNLANPDGGLQTFVADVCNWMLSDTDSVLWSANFIQPNVYITSYQSGTAPVPLVGHFHMDPPNGGPSYTCAIVSYTTGTVVFNPAVPATATVNSVVVPNVVSVDCTPLSMSPEIALYHLFVDFGAWNPAFLKFDNTGIQIPVIEVGREVPIIQAATDIVSMIAPRGQRWRLWIDEIGYIRLTEGALDHAPVKFLTDTRDLLKCTFQQDTNQMYNVVRATGTSVNNQPVTAISYDVTSINIYAQQPTYDVPSQYLNIVMGMDPGAAMSYMNGLVSSFLFQYSRPELTAEIQVMPDTSIQVGDCVNITETMTGASGNWVVNQINDVIQESEGSDSWTQTWYVGKMNYSQDMNFGIQANIGAPSPNNANTIQAQSGFIQTVSFQTSFDSQPVYVVSGGQPVYDSSFNPLIYTWRQGVPLNISITVNPPFNSGYNGTLWMWRWMYIGSDCYTNVYTNFPTTFTNTVVTGSGTMIGQPNFGAGWAQDIRGFFSTYGITATYPYDVRANTEPNQYPNNYPTPTARRFWRPLLICPDWFQNDGGGPTNAVPGYTYNPTTLDAHHAPSFTFNSTWTGGLGPYLNYDPFNAANNQWASFYGMLRVAQNNYFNNCSTYFRGQELYASGTAGSQYLGVSSQVSFGVDYGPVIWDNQNWLLNTYTVGQNNYVTDSEFNYLSGGHQQWTVSNFNLGTDAGGNNALVTAAGVSTQATAVGPQIPVNGSHNPLSHPQTVTFSCKINATSITSGTNIRAYIKDSSNTTVCTLTQTAGTNSLLSATFTIPTGITYYVVHFDTGTFVAGSGNQIKYSQTFLQLSNVYCAPYIPSTVVSSNLFYNPTTKVTPCFLQILTATDFGTMQLKTIAFQLEM